MAIGVVPMATTVGVDLWAAAWEVTVEAANPEIARASTKRRMERFFMGVAPVCGSILDGRKQIRGVE